MSNLSRRSNTSKCAHDEILISSAKLLRTWEVGRVCKKPKSRKFTATLMLTLASMRPITVVGTLMKFVLRRYAAHANLGLMLAQIPKVEKP
ncbi:hypothetical protein RRF57_012296 [Xylaria bambusicola]|uniref:Uncharacterized protein n=1 Tax=Xylaria bambusicola TaxID=326684 RepID=A0AAN7UPC1_9PEZI